MLTTEVERLLDFITIKTDLELCLVDQRAKPKAVTVRSRETSSVNQNTSRFRITLDSLCLSLQNN